jgi:hypothetical protein
MNISRHSDSGSEARTTLEKSTSPSGRRPKRTLAPSVEAMEDRTVLSPVLFASDRRGRLFTVDVPTGTVEVRGTMAKKMFDIAFDPSGTLYGVDGRSTLFRIDPNSGATTRIGRVGDSINALVFAPDGTLYGAGRRFYEIDPTTGAGTRIGSFGRLRSAGDLAFDAQGTLYLSTTTNRLARVDRTIGAAAVIGPIGSRDVFGLAFGPDGVMYGVSDRTQQLVAINLQTGRGTAVSRFGGQGASGAFGSSFFEEALTPRLSIESVSVQEGNSGPTTAVFTVSLSSPVSRPVSVQFATAPGTATAGVDYLSTSGTVQFEPGTVTQTVTVQINGDTTPEADESFTVNLASAVNATIATSQGMGTIRNDDVAILRINSISRPEGDGGTSPFTFTVTLASPSEIQVSVRFATADGSATLADNDYQAASGELVFGPGDTQRFVTILVNGDFNVEPDESFSVILSDPVNATILSAVGIGAIQNEDIVIR